MTIFQLVMTRGGSNNAKGEVSMLLREFRASNNFHDGQSYIIGHAKSHICSRHRGLKTASILDGEDRGGRSG
jgi:hypothetical protein